MTVPRNMYGDFTYESCMPEFSKIKMMKNNDGSGRRYWISIPTTEKLEEIGMMAWSESLVFSKQ